MPHILPVSKTTTDTKDAKARRAVFRFRQMLPTLTGYAQALTGRTDIHVELSATSNGETDGTRILMRPPLALGEDMPHQPRLCNKRDRNLQMRCTACRQREQVVLPIHHEIAHNAFNTFLKPDLRDIDSALEDATRISGTRYGKAVCKRLTDSSDSYLGLADLMGEWMHPLLNALEDARIDAEMFRARPGIRVMYHGSLNAVRDNGIEGQDPITSQTSYTMWSEQPIDFQAIFACYCVITRYNYEGWFHSSVDAAMQDELLRDLLVQIRTTHSVREVYRLCFPIMERLRELGFCKRPSDPEEPEETEDAENGEGDSGSSSDSPGADDAGEPGQGGRSPAGDSAFDSNYVVESSDAEEASSSQEDISSRSRNDNTSTEFGSPVGDTEADGDDADSVSEQHGPDEDSNDNTDPSLGKEYTGTSTIPGDSAGREDQFVESRPEPGEPTDFESYILKAGGHDDQFLERVGVLSPGESPKDDKAVIIAIIQGLFFDQPSRHVTGVKLHRYEKQTPESTGWNPKKANYFGNDLDVAEAVLGASLMKMRVAFSDNQRHRKEKNLKSGKVNSRVLGRRAALGDERLFHKRTILAKKNYKVVLGLDISGSTSGHTVTRIKRACMAQAELLHRAGIDFAVYAHTGSDSSTGGIDLDIYVVKEFIDPWNEKVKQALRDLYSTEFNLDGHTLEFYRKALDRTTGTDKVLVYYTDGAMPAENHDEELAILLREVRLCKQRQYTLLFVGVENDEPKTKYGLDMVRLDNDADISKVVEQLGKRLAKG